MHFLTDMTAYIIVFDTSIKGHWLGPGKCKLENGSIEWFNQVTKKSNYHFNYDK